MIKATLISGLIALVLIIIGLVVIAMYYDQPGFTKPIIINGSDMVIHRGHGYKTGHKLVVTAADHEKRIRIISPQLSFKAKDMPFMAWTFTQFGPRTGVWVGWVNSDNPKKLNMMPAILPYDSTAVYKMNDHPEWRGDILALGFGFDRQMYNSFTLQKIEVRPYSIGLMIENTIDEWVSFQGWSLKSINYIKSIHDGSISIKKIIYIWIALSSIIYVIKNNFNFKEASRGVTIYFLIAWFVLDVLWQINLIRQNYLTYHLYSGKSLHEKRMTGPDYDLYKFSLEVKKYIPNTQVRVFLTGKGVRGNIIYEQPRLQYYLMPHNISYFENHYAIYAPTIENYNFKFNIGYFVNEGDYVLVAGEDDRITYDKKLKKISFGEKYKFNSELLLETNQGGLYRIDSRIEG